MSRAAAARAGLAATQISAADRWISRTAAATVAALAGIAGAISYGHMRQLARLHGQAGWYAHAFPLSVDGIEIVASLVLLADRRAGRRSGWLPWAALAAGTAGSLAANVVTADPGAISRLIAGWPALALLIAVKLLSGMLDRDTAHRPVPGIPASRTTADDTTNVDHAPSPLAVPVPSSARPPAGDPVRRSGLAEDKVSSKLAPGTGTMSRTAISFSFVSRIHFEGSRGGRLTSRRHAQTERKRSGYSTSPYTTPVDVNRASARRAKERPATSLNPAPVPQRGTRITPASPACPLNSGPERLPAGTGPHSGPGRLAATTWVA